MIYMHHFISSIQEGGTIIVSIFMDEEIKIDLGDFLNTGFLDTNNSWCLFSLTEWGFIYQ